jgi:hypothetical protein
MGRLATRRQACEDGLCIKARSADEILALAESARPRYATRKGVSAEGAKEERLRNDAIFDTPFSRPFRARRLFHAIPRPRRLSLEAKVSSALRALVRRPSPRRAVAVSRVAHTPLLAPGQQSATDVSGC